MRKHTILSNQSLCSDKFKVLANRWLLFVRLRANVTINLVLIIPDPRLCWSTWTHVVFICKFTKIAVIDRNFGI